ncbi:MAG: hypothetical protein ABI467_29445 [Kofleriaceae bacterium]
MKMLLGGLFLGGLLLIGACAGPGRAKLAETPTANSRANTGLAPPASQSDRDRSDLVNSNDSMEATQRAYREADHSSKQAPLAPLPGQPAPATKKQPGARPSNPKPNAPVPAAP